MIQHVSIAHIKNKGEYKWKMLQFIVSSILSGITWDIIKGSPKLFQLYFLKKNSIDEEKLEEIIDNIPLNEKNKKNVLKKYLKNNEEYQMLVMQTISKMQQSRRRRTLIWFILIVAIMVYGIRTMYNQKNLRIFSNEYIEVVYNGLEKRENTTVTEGGDTYFYNTLWDLKNRKYIRVVKFPTITALHVDLGPVPDSYDWDYISDSCQSQEISLCLQYANSELKFSEKTAIGNGHFKSEMIPENPGFLLVHAIEGTKYCEGMSNTVFVKSTDSNYKFFLIGKCLYADGDGLMMAILSYSGVSYDDFLDSTNPSIVRMKKCFDSIKQVEY